MHSFYKKNYLYCPYCQTKLQTVADYLSCPKCQLAVYDNPAPATVNLFTQDKKILLAKRKHEPMAGAWDSIGGFMKNGESIEQCALRETKEELKVEAKIIKYLGSFCGEYAGVPVIDFVFWTKIIKGEPQASDDVAQIEWFNFDNLPSNFAFERTLLAVDLLKKERFL